MKHEERFSSVENAADIIVGGIGDVLATPEIGNVADALFRIADALNRIAAALESGKPVDARAAG